jgi:hypothetical protein
MNAHLEDGWQPDLNGEIGGRKREKDLDNWKKKYEESLIFFQLYDSRKSSFSILTFNMFLSGR